MDDNTNKENIIVEILKNTLCMRCGESLFSQLGKDLNGNITLYVSSCNICKHSVQSAEEHW